MAEDPREFPSTSLPFVFKVQLQVGGVLYEYIRSLLLHVLTTFPFLDS